MKQLLFLFLFIPLLGIGQTPLSEESIKDSLTTSFREFDDYLEGYRLVYNKTYRHGFQRALDKRKNSLFLVKGNMFNEEFYVNEIAIDSFNKKGIFHRTYFATLRFIGRRLVFMPDLPTWSEFKITTDKDLERIKKIMEREIHSFKTIDETQKATGIVLAFF